MSTGVWIGLGIAAVFAVAIIWRLSGQAEQQIRSILDDETASIVGKCIGERTDLREDEARLLLQKNRVPSEFETVYNESIDFVMMEFSRTGSRYHFKVTIENDGEIIFTSSRAIGLDELPDAVQEEFLRGNDDVTVPWHPAFQNPTSE